MRIFRNLTDKLHLYKSLDSLKILTFWRIIKEKNACLLDFDYKEGKKYTVAQQKEIEDTWLRLYDEYFVLRDNSKNKMQLIKSFDELNLREKITQIKNNAEFLNSLKGYVGLVPDEYLESYEQQIYKVVKKIEPKINLKLFEGVDVNLKILERVLSSYINRYNQEHKQREKVVEKEVDNVYEVVASAESWLNRSLNIDDMVTSHWIAIEKQVENKQKAEKKRNKIK